MRAGLACNLCVGTQTDGGIAAVVAVGEMGPSAPFSVYVAGSDTIALGAEAVASPCEAAAVAAGAGVARTAAAADAIAAGGEGTLIVCGADDEVMERLLAIAEAADADVAAVFVQDGALWDAER